MHSMVAITVGATKQFANSCPTCLEYCCKFMCTDGIVYDNVAGDTFLHGQPAGGQQ